ATLKGGAKRRIPQMTLDSMLKKTTTGKLFTFCFLISAGAVLPGKERKSLVLLMWIVTTAVPPNALNSKYWNDVKEEFNVTSVPEIPTIWKRLPVLREVALMEEEKVLCSLTSFVTTIDLWTSDAGTKYLVIDYHGIIPNESFKMWCSTLDLVPFENAAFAT